MAAGLVTVAHASGGPKSDIVVEYDGGSTGFLAATATEYADALEKAFGMCLFLFLSYSFPLPSVHVFLLH